MEPPYVVIVAISPEGETEVANLIELPDSPDYQVGACVEPLTRDDRSQFRLLGWSRSEKG